MRRALTILVIALFLGAGQEVFGQGDTDCLTVLSNAENEFAAGRFIGIPDMLSDCLDRNRFSNEEKVRVYMLLTQVYLLTDNPTAADEAYLKLLKANPEFLPSDQDPIDVIYLSKKFTSTPIFTPHFKIGGNLTSQSIIFPQNTSATPSTTRLRYIPLGGWTAGGGVEWNVTDNLGVGGEVFFSEKVFRRSIQDIFFNDSQQMTERQFWIDVPLYLRYGKALGNIRPFAYAGGALNILIAANAAEVLNDKIQGTGTEAEGVRTTATPPTSIMFRRKVMNRSLVFGGGAKFKISKDFIVVDLRFMPGLSNVVNMKTNNFGDKEATIWDPSATKYGSVPDIFKVNNYSVSFGYVRPIYDPRRTNRVKTKQVSKRLGRE